MGTSIILIMASERTADLSYTRRGMGAVEERHQDRNLRKKFPLTTSAARFSDFLSTCVGGVGRRQQLKLGRAS